ncbi:MAG: peptidylprolyl isomerase [Alphaproteobacteria bacterium]|nr:peptidylprolyl isomerase [Alphaproteobacteria bacterium]
MSRSESGNALVVVLALLVLVAAGAIAFVSGYINVGGKDAAPQAAEASAEPASGEVADASGAAQDTASPQTQENGEATAEAPALEVRPGNPVVAKVNGQDITRLDVFNFIQTLPPNARQMPVQQLFPLAVDQVVSAKIIAAKTDKADLGDDPEVKKQLEMAKQQIERTVYLQKEVEKALTEERLQAAYEKYKADFPDIDEAKAKHILVKEEKLAKDIIKQLDEGSSFDALAKAHSTDATAANGGELGYFAKTDVVPEFSEAAFSMKPGEYSKKPVKSEFGYHVIQLEELRKRPPADFEQAKPFLEGQLRQQILSEVVQKWRDDAKIERFDINGDPIEPAAGDESAEDAPAQ